MKKIQAHPRLSVMKPPRTSPAAPPPAATAVHTPMARFRSRPPGKVVEMMESAAGATMAAPRP
jgi:hypothetical protein